MTGHGRRLKEEDSPRCGGGESHQTHFFRSIPGGGFTLIEVAACLVVLGLLTGLAALSLRGMQHNVDLETWVERVAALDHQTRDRAESQGAPWRVVIDLEQQRIWSESTVQSGQEGHANPLAMPRGWELTATRVHRGPQSQAATHRGQEALPYATNRVSRTYALGLQNEQGRGLWLLVAGGSGQLMKTHDENEIEDIFTALHAAGDDAG